MALVRTVTYQCSSVVHECFFGVRQFFFLTKFVKDRKNHYHIYVEVKLVDTSRYNTEVIYHP